MRQYEFEIIEKRTRSVNQKRATAATAAIARAQVVLMYGLQFEVGAMPCNEYAPHEVLGEIDCSDYPEGELPLLWLMREAAAIEGVAQ
jgi:hypothetical protein